MSDNFPRLLLVLREIPLHPNKITTTEILRRLAVHGLRVTQRTIQRDLNALGEYFSLSCDGAKPAGWSWDSGRAAICLPALGADGDILMQTARRLLEREFSPDSLGALKPLFQTVDPLPADKIRVPSRGPSRLPLSVSPATLAAIQAALRDGTRLRLDYRPLDDSDTHQEEVHPLGLVLRDRATYLVGGFESGRIVRHIALSRITSAKTLTEPVQAPKGFDLDAYLRTHGLDFSSGRDIALQLVLAESVAMALRDSPLAEDQRILPSEDDGFVMVSATVPDSWELRWWLLSMGDQVEVLAPRPLRALFGEIAGNMARYYEPA